MNLKELLLEYKTITESMINEVRGEGYIEPLVLQREDIISKMKGLNFSKEEFKKIAVELEILEVENKLHNIISEEKGNIKEELDKIKRIKNANQNYSNNMPILNFFNKKI